MKPKQHARIWILSLLLILSVLLPSAVLYWRGDPLGFLYCIPGAVVVGVSVCMLLYTRRNQLNYIAELNESSENAQLAALQQLPFGFCVIDTKGIVVEYNQCFRDEIMDGEDMFGRNLLERILLKPAAAEQIVTWKQRHYRLSSLPFEDEEGKHLTTVLWEDRTELEKLRDTYRRTRPCVVLLVIDNYEDMIQSIKESDRLAAGVSIEKLMESFVANTGGILRRLKNDRFIAVLEDQYMQQIVAEKFAILDAARQILMGGRDSVTLSIGVGQGGDTLQECEQLAQQSLEMALGRGGDQAALKKKNEDFEFFGGKSQGIEKKSRVKTRAAARMIREQIQSSRKVFLMGHRYGDLDSIGGCCGLAGAIRIMDKPVRVVCDPKKNLSQQLIALVKEEVGASLFLTPEQAVDAITDDTLLIIVDTNNKDIIESPELYQRAKRVVVIDHHRQSVNFIDNAAPFYHEPFASSACEMITELLQYFQLTSDLDPALAECLLAGIMLDTKNFVMRTGVRTFEAAAYLRKLKADTIRVKGLFSGSIDAYRSRTEIVSAAEIFGRYAIALVPENTPDVRIVASQAADELLNITGVDASFTICKVKGKEEEVNISARSYGDVNVQVIMEKLGGGGHQSMAATQIPGITQEEAKQRLIAVLREAG